MRILAPMITFDTTDTPVKQARVARGWTQAQAAEAAAVDQATWSRIERGVQQPRVDLLLRICDCLSLTADDVLHPWRAQPDTECAA